MVLLAERCGCIIGIPAPIMGVTVLAAGTSIPDALGSIIAAKSRQGDMAVANAIGSNVFDILIGLGLPYGIYGVTEAAAKEYGGYKVSMNGIIAQMVILFLTVVATFMLFMFFQWRLTANLGRSMLIIYIAFCIYSIAVANDPRWYADNLPLTGKPNWTKATTQEKWATAIKERYINSYKDICTPCPIEAGVKLTALKALQLCP